MKALVRFTLSQTVFINVIFVILTVAGIFSLFTTPVENMPPVDMGKVFITTIYYGASADDVENLVTNEIEDALDGLENVEYIQSRSRRNSSSVEVKFLDDTDYETQYDELRFRVLNIKKQLPEGTDDPIFFYVDTKMWVPVIVINLIGDLSNQTLKLLADELKSNIIKIDGIQEVSISGEYDKQFHVTIDPAKLRDFGVSFNEVAEAIRAFNTKIPTGRFKQAKNNLLLDTGNTLDSQNEVLNVVVRRDGDGSFIHVRDLVTTSGVSHRDPDTIASVNSKSTIKLLVQKEDSSNAVTIAEEVKSMAKEFESNHSRDGLSIVMTYDSTVEINDSVKTLGGNMLLGMCFVTIILWVTLGFRNAMLTAMGIPFSFLVTLIIVKYSGQSINTISLFSFVLVSGIIVDDAIIIVENIYRHLEMGKTRKDAVVDGVSEVFLPVISSALTTILAFVPMLIMTGTTGDFFSVIPKAVSFALFASLLEALFILPVHVLDWGPRSNIKAKRKGFSRWFFDGMWKIYYAILTFLLNHKIISVLGISGLFFLALAMMLLSVTGIVPLIKVKFFQDSYLRYHVAFQMPPGTSVEGTDLVVRDISTYITGFGKQEVGSVNGTAGMMESKDYQQHRAQHYGQVVVELPPQENQHLSGVKDNDVNAYLDIVRDKLIEFAKANREKWGGMPTLDIFGENTGPPVGKAVNIRVSAASIEEAQLLADKMLNFLETGDEFRDLVNLDDNRADLQTVVKHMVNQKKALEYNLDSRIATALIAGTLNGMSVGNFRTDGEEIPLLVRLAKTGDKGNTEGVGLAHPSDILEVPIIEHSSAPVYLGDIADAIYVKEPDIRNRYKGKPTLTITADIREGSQLSAGRVAMLASRYFDTISPEYPGVTLHFGGEFESTSRAYTSLMFAFIIAVMAIYLVLASQFNDYFQPLMILTAIAFAFIGVVFGMFFTRSVFTIGSFLSVVGLSGVAVNDSLILIDFMNKQKQKGLAIREAIIEACSARMRPVLITTATTMMGMLPMAVGIPRKSVTWAPMATAFATGLVSATLLALLIIPVEYEITEKAKLWFRKKFNLKQP
ncbi:efflux RND transporter permease subunit [Desulfamplus magnetovallimortis]|uniref:efflux RND transporter permease subunit n=1 Tax=Desulfamplus magnetovallimortis TaxID=1246637 RepID=UPI001C95764B|nr:efflux RND transporter permease subunit [Desulfamplus magnetovallimortis]